MPDSKIYSLFLVTAQFVLIFIIGSIALPASLSFASLPGVFLILAACLLGLSALATLRLSNLSVMPEPVDQGTLIKSGPYRFIRHPMYTAVLLLCGGLVLITPKLLSAVLFILLIVALQLKIKREEALLVKAYPEYPHYRQSTGALLPTQFKKQ